MEKELLFIAGNKYFHYGLIFGIESSSGVYFSNRHSPTNHPPTFPPRDKSHVALDEVRRFPLPEGILVGGGYSWHNAVAIGSESTRVGEGFRASWISLPVELDE